MGCGQSRKVLVIGISSVAVLLGFSFTGFVIQDAEAYMNNYYLRSASSFYEFDYYIFNYEYVDPGDKGRLDLRCLEGSSFVNGRIYAPSMTGSFSGKLIFKGAGYNEDGNYTYEQYYRAEPPNNLSYRTYFYAYVYCAY